MIKKSYPTFIEKDLSQMLLASFEELYKDHLDLQKKDVEKIDLGITSQFANVATDVHWRCYQYGAFYAMSLANRRLNFVIDWFKPIPSFFSAMKNEAQRLIRKINGN